MRASLRSCARRCATKASAKSSLNLPQTAFTMYPNPTQSEPPLARTLSREHYDWQASCTLRAHTCPWATSTACS